jgi:hypothetical protein
MMRLLVLSGVVLFGATLHRVAVAEEQKGAKAAPDPTAELLAKLRQPVALPAGDMKLAEFVAAVEKATGVPVTVNTAAFRADGEGESVGELAVRLAGSKKLSAAVALRHTLGQNGWTYLVRRDHVEIVPLEYARKESRQPVRTDANDDQIPPQPLVSAVFKERPLTEALADLAAEYDLTVVLAPQAADKKAGFVTARLLNVPADRAVELLAVQADLRVVRRGAAFLVTTKDHRDSLFNERHERARQKVELENLRNAPLGGMLGQPPRANVPGGFCGGFCGNVGIAGNAGFAGNIGSGFGSGFGGVGGFGGSGAGFAGRPANPPAPPPAPR